jgi:hypothetical protein
VSEAAEFFLGSGAHVARYDCLEISHPNFSQVYRLVRNAPAGLRVSQEGAGISWVFDGDSNLIDFGNVMSWERTEERTLGCWFTSSSAAVQILQSKQPPPDSRPGYRLNLNVGAVTFALIRPTGAFTDIEVETVNTFDDGAEHFVVVTYDGSGLAAGVTIRVDGVVQALNVLDDTLGASTIVNTAPFCLGGRDSDGGGNSLDGTMRHAFQYSRELTSGECASLYSGGSPPDLNDLGLPDLEGWWPLDENDQAEVADGVLDHSGNDNHGTSNFGGTVSSGPADYEYCPMRVLPIASEEDLVQSLSVTLGDVGEIIATELANVWEANGLNTRPTLTYRAYRSDDLSAPIADSERVLEIASVSTSREGAAFEARAPELNASRTGELYTVERFPMLGGFL